MIKYIKNKKPRGSILIGLVLTVMIFAVLGTTMLSMFGSSTMSTVTAVAARQARYMAESGLRYALSELENSGFSRSVINRLNSTTYPLSDGGSFAVNVFAPEFKSLSDQSLSGGDTLSLVAHTGKMPEGFSFPAGAFVVNFKSFRDALIFGGTPDTFTSQVQNFTRVSDTELNVTINDDFNVDEDDLVCLAVRPASLQENLSDASSLDVDITAKDFFPKRNGAIYVSNTDGRVMTYLYKERIDDGSKVTLTNLSGASSHFPFSVETSNYVILSGKNYRIIPTGFSGADVEVSYVVSSEAVTSASDESSLPAPGESSPDFSPKEVVESLAAPLESIPDSPVIVVDTAAGTIELGGGVGSAFGAVWFGGNNNIGGIADFCVDGKCQFNYGVRVFFKLYYNGTGDGFTLAFINGDNNNKSSVGGDAGAGELMAYGGDSRTWSLGSIGYSFVDRAGYGLRSPKMALEFDTYTNPDNNSLCSGGGGTTFQSGQRNDPLSVGKDVLQYVFWGSDDGIKCRTNPTVGWSPTYDDNRHSAGGGDNPQNIKSKYCTYEDLIADDVVVDNPTDWLNGTSTKGPWTVRVEVIRGTALNAAGKYDYTLKTWIRQCNDLNCGNIDGTYFTDTGIAYEAKTPHIEQTVELSTDEHTKFETFLFGLTEATGGAVQTVKISDLKMSFIRPDDTAITSDPGWQ